ETARTTDLESVWKGMKEQFIGRQDELMGVGGQRYETENLRRVGLKETVWHFQDISDWYTREIAKAKNARERCQGAIIDYSRRRDEVNRQVGDVISALGMGRQSAGDEGPEVAQPVGVRPDTLGARRAVGSASDAYYAALENCR